jgi:iron complex outermembrane recepter protein
MNTHFRAGVALAALIVPTYAFAQSSGTIAAEEGDEIVVTGSRTTRAIGGVEVPDSPKARTIIDNEVLRQAAPGQTLLQAINIVPSVNFTNNDPFGSSGGNIRIRGFDGNRISLTFDGLPLNDTGNYAIFSNQQLDPEIVGQVNVNQGTTDVDSPTAASSGGTINYRTLVPSEEAGAMLVGSVGGTYDNRLAYRTFGMLQTGDLFGSGVRAFISASQARNEKFRGPGQIYKQQYNARIYKELGDDGDFISLGAHYNQNRNNAYRNNLTLAQAAYDYAVNGRFTYDNNAVCLRPTPGAGAQNEANFAQTGVTAVPTNLNFTYQANGALPNQTFVPSASPDTSCTNYAGLRINPSNTGNVRFNSRFSLTDKLTFTLDAGYQYVLANGGGFTAQPTAATNGNLNNNATSESSLLARGFGTAAGSDFNGDGDVADTLAFYTPSNTNTNRYTLLSSLRWDFADSQYVRIAYALDLGRHRQTGEYGYLDTSGNPEYVFGGRNGARTPRDANGYALRTRDRFSIAELNQVSGEYRGKFLDNKLEVVLGVRAPFFRRELNQFCYTLASSAFPICTSGTLGTTAVATTVGFYVIPANSVFTTGIPGNAVYAPFKSTYNYKEVLPNLGFTVRPVDDVQIYGAYAKGLSVPRTDNLYRAPRINVEPERSDNYDLGIRYSTARVQAAVGVFYNRFTNRIQQTTDNDPTSPTYLQSIDRNVGTVEIKGAEASLNIRPFPWFSFRGFGSYLNAKYKDNLVLSPTLTLPLAGKRLVETPEWQYGYRAQLSQGPFQVGLEFKQRTDRAATDLNDVIIPGYNTFNIDARISLADYGLKKTFIQLNVDNVFNTQYLGSISSTQSLGTNIRGLVPGLASTGSLSGGANPTFAIGSPRAWILSLQVGF